MLLVLCLLLRLSITLIDVGEVTFSILHNASINTTVGPSSTGGYTCIPSIPNGEVTTSGQLMISGRLDVSDGGVYQCTSSEIIGYIIIVLVATGEYISFFIIYLGIFLKYLLFLARAFIVSSSGDVVALKGSSIVLKVNASGIPDAITYEWKQNGVTIPLQTSSMLTLSSVNTSDIGLYECIPSNSLGTFNISVIKVDLRGNNEEEVTNMFMCLSIHSMYMHLSILCT